MLAPLTTLIFLASLWLIAQLIAELFDKSGGRVLAALAGRPHRVETTIPAMRLRVCAPRPAQPMRARQQWSAAA